MVIEKNKKKHIAEDPIEFEIAMIQSKFPKTSKDDLKEAIEVFQDPFLVMEILAILEANLILLNCK